MARLFYTIDEVVNRPKFPSDFDPTHIYFHFQPARPADLLITRDLTSEDLNMAGGTIGQLTENPYTICLHIAKRSFHSYRNIKKIGVECVVALPGRDIVRETWISALPVPRGIFEAEIAGLTLLPSKVVSVPGIAECPLNLECKVEWFKDWNTHVAVFLRVLAVSIDEEYLKRNRLDVVSFFPTYEVDDLTNAFGGSIERLGVNGEILECPGFPVGPKQSYHTDYLAWVSDLQQANYLSIDEKGKILSWLEQWQPEDKMLEAQPPKVSRFFELVAWEEWQAVHDLLAE